MHAIRQRTTRLAAAEARSREIIERRVAARYQPLVNAAREAKLQIEYLHDKFGQTGSGMAVWLRLDTALNDLDREFAHTVD